MEYQHQKSENQIGFNLEDSYLLTAFMAFKVEKEMATHSSILAWRIPGTGEPHGLLFVFSLVSHNSFSTVESAILKA